jgi:hypothetical protein
MTNEDHGSYHGWRQRRTLLAKEQEFLPEAVPFTYI